MQGAKDLFALLSNDMIANVAHEITNKTWPIIAKQLPAKIDEKDMTDLRARGFCSTFD